MHSLQDTERAGPDTAGPGTSGWGQGVRDRSVLAETATPEGVRVIIFEDTWVLHILDPRSGHGELEHHLPAVLDSIASPDHREADA